MPCHVWEQNIYRLRMHHVPQLVASDTSKKCIPSSPEKSALLSALWDRLIPSVDGQAWKDLLSLDICMLYFNVRSGYFCIPGWGLSVEFFLWTF